MRDILAEMTMLLMYSIITIHTLSKRDDPNCAQKKNKREIPNNIRLEKNQQPNSDAYINNKYPVSTLTVAAQHMAGKKRSCKLDCSQAYYC